MEKKAERVQSLITTSLYLNDAVLMGDMATLLDMLREDPLILDRCMIENAGNLKQSPLHIAASTGHLDIVKTLLAIKPNMCFTHDHYGRNPIHVASIHGHVEVLRELIHANPEAARERTNNGETFLHMYIFHGHKEGLQGLLDLAESDVLNAKDNNGNTIMHYAVRSKQHEMVKFILEDTRIDINAINKDNLTALDTHILLTESQNRHSHKRSLGKVMNWKDDDEIGPSLEDAKALRSKDALKIIHMDNWVESKSNGLMVVASLIATMAFTLGITPPGGCWQDDDRKKWDEYPPGVSIIYTIYKEKYTTPLLLSNVIAFGSSLFVILLLISGLPNGPHLVVILMATMSVAVIATTVSFGYTIYLVTFASRNFAHISIYIGVGLISFMLLAHLLLIIGRFINGRRILRGRMIKSYQSVREASRHHHIPYFN